jgi:hypothetical protein
VGGTITQVRAMFQKKKEKHKIKKRKKHAHKTNTTETASNLASLLLLSHMWDLLDPMYVHIFCACVREGSSFSSRSKRRRSCWMYVSLGIPVRSCFKRYTLASRTHPTSKPCLLILIGFFGRCTISPPYGCPSRNEISGKR